MMFCGSGSAQKTASVIVVPARVPVEPDGITWRFLRGGGRGTVLVAGLALHPARPHLFLNNRGSRGGSLSGPVSLPESRVRFFLQLRDILRAGSHYYGFGS